MHWETGPAEVGAAIATAVAVAIKLIQRRNGGSIKERLVRLETKVDLILDTMRLGPRSDSGEK